MSEIKTAEQRIHKLEGGEGDSFVTVEQALIAERDELRKALADRDAKLAALEKQDRHVRRLLCIAVADRPYMDDGEASDQEIDYLREPPADIERKLQERGKKRLAAAGAAPNAWKDAILDVMTIYGMDAPTTDAPEKIIKDLIELATRVAIDPILVAGAAPAPMELVLTFNFGTLVKAEFQDRILYEVDLSPKSYFEVCWAHGWAGDYETEEDAENECLSLCGYSRSIREIKPGDDGYKNPRQPQLTEKRFLLASAGAAPVPEDWRSAVAMAYGHLWHINNEPMAPIPLRSEESASYAARKLLRDLLTTEERGEAINSVGAMLAAALKEQA